MAQWYKHNRELFRKEREALASLSPLMMLSVVGPGFRINPVLETRAERAVAHGTYTLKTPIPGEDVDFGIVLWFPGNYPRSPPIMFCNDAKLPVNTINRHILKDGQACLEVWPEIKRRWTVGPHLTSFLSTLVDPFLAWQVYFDAFGEPPEWGERAHGRAGIIQYYANLLGISEEDNVLGFMKLVSRKNRPKGHEPCPCNSGSKLRHCHRESIYQVRDKLFWEDVHHDVKILEKNR